MDIQVLLMPVDARWAQRFFGVGQDALEPGALHLHHTPYRPDVLFALGQRLLWIQRPGRRRPARVLGGSVIQTVQVGRARDLLETRPEASLPRQAVTALAGDAYAPLVALGCQLVIRGAAGGQLDDALPLAGGRHRTRPLRLGRQEGAALWEAALEASTSESLSLPTGRSGGSIHLTTPHAALSTLRRP